MTNTIYLSTKAASRIRALGETQNNPALFLRVRVDAGGCSGFKYQFDLEKEPPAPDDVIVERDGSRLVVDTLSLSFLGGAEVDFVSDLSGESFQIKNPNADSSCGCGASFAVKS